MYLIGYQHTVTNMDLVCVCNWCAPTDAVRDAVIHLHRDSDGGWFRYKDTSANLTPAVTELDNTVSENTVPTVTDHSPACEIIEVVSEG